MASVLKKNLGGNWTVLSCAQDIDKDSSLLVPLIRRMSGLLFLSRIYWCAYIRSVEYLNHGVCAEKKPRGNGSAQEEHKNITLLVPLNLENEWTEAFTC